MKPKEHETIVLFYLISNVFSNTHSSDYEDTDSHHEKVKRFEKHLGKPNIYYDEENNLVLEVTIYNGQSNRVLDSGVNSVGIQLKDSQNVNVNEELVKYLSQVLHVHENLFTVAPGLGQFKRIVKIKGSAVRPYDVIDKLVTGLEITAKEEPSALRMTDPTVEDLGESGVKDEEDATRVFDWRGRRF